MKRVPYTYVLNFDTTVAAGAESGDKSFTVDGDGDFVIEDFNAEFWTPAASGGGAIINTPFARDPSPKDADNTYPSLAAIEISFRDPEAWQNAPVRVSNLVRKGSQNIMLTQRRIRANTTVSAKIKSYLSALGIQGQVAFFGYRELPG